ncbi:PREDICTED: ribonuclease kappa-like isoform X1 [Acropora digitifera]|uniref:ribonuclease kappa-like isoform X1 n=1 Tax=Acropora digitifera TaxID=70779 RepID=UPI00077A9BA9|nr:PREDICTED: ribonuclease kappa-like isoform X1 [Acropora digitifera]
MLMKRFCGPKLANCCLILSIWGIVMLLLLGIFFKTRSVALRDDISSKLKDKEGYNTSANNCFIAAGIYIGTLLLSAHQKWVNNRMGDTQKLYIQA